MVVNHVPVYTVPDKKESRRGGPLLSIFSTPKNSANGCVMQKINKLEEWNSEAELLDSGRRRANEIIPVRRHDLRAKERRHDPSTCYMGYIRIHPLKMDAFPVSYVEGLDNCDVLSGLTHVATRWAAAKSRFNSKRDAVRARRCNVPA